MSIGHSAFGDITMPFAPNWFVRSNFIYVAPGGSNTTDDPRFARESWNDGTDSGV